MKQFDFITEKGEHIHLTSDQIKDQKKLEELAKADMAKQEVKLGKEELADLLKIDKGLITLNVYKEDGNDEVISIFKARDLHLGEWREEIFFRIHQGPRLDDLTRTFSSFLLAEVDKRNLNPLKQMKVIKQMR
nr:hypothetical protein [Tanacetum cinerariifolium]